MKQTNSYQFNLVESGDTFSPVPLNENMEKVETALGVGGATCRIATGSYEGTGSHGASYPSSLTFPFKPIVVFLTTETGSNFVVMIRPATRPESEGGAAQNITWSDSGITWYATASHAAQFNDSGATYHWVAIGASR